MLLTLVRSVLTPAVNTIAEMLYIYVSHIWFAGGDEVCELRLYQGAFIGGRIQERNIF